MRRFATSEPPLGSVIASAEIFLPDNTCGNTRALTSGRAARAIGGEPMVWLIRLALTPPAPARASSWEATIFMNWSAGNAAIFLRKAEAEQADRRGLLVERARKFAGLVPLMGIRLDLLLDKAAHHLAKGFVLGGVEWAFHARRSLVQSHATWPEQRLQTCVQWLAAGAPIPHAD